MKMKEHKQCNRYSLSWQNTFHIIHELDVKTEDCRIRCPNQGPFGGWQGTPCMNHPKAKKVTLCPTVPSKSGNTAHLPKTHLESEGERANGRTALRKEKTIKVSHINLAGVSEWETGENDRKAILEELTSENISKARKSQIKNLLSFKQNKWKYTHQGMS